MAYQDLKSLDDEELKDFVLESETGAFKESPLKYWTINNTDKGKERLDVRFLPTSFYKEEQVEGLEFDRWCRAQLQLAFSKERLTSMIEGMCKELDDDPTFQSDAWKKASDLVDTHVRIPQFAAGRRTTNLYRLCQATSAIGDDWENRLVVVPAE